MSFVLLSFVLQHAESLLLNRQVKSYGFLSNSSPSVDGVDDAEMFKMTDVSAVVRCIPS